MNIQHLLSCTTPAMTYYPDEPADEECPYSIASPRLSSDSHQAYACAKHYAGRLALLVHANKCQKASTCVVSNCHLAQDVLAHVTECTSNCELSSCTQAKILLRHYRTCDASKKRCLVCQVLRTEFSYCFPRRSTTVAGFHHRMSSSSSPGEKCSAPVPHHHARRNSQEMNEAAMALLSLSPEIPPKIRRLSKDFTLRTATCA